MYTCSSLIVLQNVIAFWLTSFNKMFHYTDRVALVHTATALTLLQNRRAENILQQNYTKSNKKTQMQNILHYINYQLEPHENKGGTFSLCLVWFLNTIIFNEFYILHCVDVCILYLIIYTCENKIVMVRCQEYLCSSTIPQLHQPINILCIPLGISTNRAISGFSRRLT